ncbi:YoaK family protein [Komagataeibacter nataicola]|uniref:YoaK family protein n=1 Tax=Komagataeibacter nataicola TaxID=265960 RepID=UPI0028B12EE0|nr:YoaK family protein [Komagataeibacter nataicola]WNM08330.1 YoaK family protein [Komagataeibacter nataicola]
MLVHEGPSRSIGSDLRLGCTLAAVAGGMNVTGFLAIGSYAANMTGNLSAMATGLVQGGRMAVLCGLGLVVAFVAGAVLATLRLRAGCRRGVACMHARIIVLEGTALVALGMVAACLPTGACAGMLGYGLGFLMGMQNATVTHISGARVRTTHMTGMLTDLGLELAQWMENRATPSPDVTARLRLHGAIITSFVLGGSAGALGYGLWGARSLMGLGAALILLALPAVLRGR